MTTRILRERHRPVWRRKGVLVAGVAIALGLGLGATAWHLGGAVPVHDIAVALPDTEVGGEAVAATSGATPGMAR